MSAHHFGALFAGGYLVHCRIFRNIPGLYPLGNNGTTLSQCDNRKYLQTLLNVPWGKKITSSQEPLF